MSFLTSGAHIQAEHWPSGQTRSHDTARARLDLCVRGWSHPMIRKLASGQYRLYSRKRNPATGRRRNLGTFGSRAAAQKHERAVQFFKHGG